MPRVSSSETGPPEVDRAQEHRSTGTQERKNPGTQVVSRKSGVKSRKSEVKSRKSEVRSQESEVRSQL